MKTSRKYILTIFMLLFLVDALAFENQKPKWKGKIEHEDGIKVIKNPKAPLYGELSFELEDNLSIGNEEDENYSFYGVRDIEVDTDGNIYVLESGNHRLQVFDRNGIFLRTIGKKGQGPGAAQDFDLFGLGKICYQQIRKSFPPLIQALITCMVFEIHDSQRVFRSYFMDAFSL